MHSDGIRAAVPLDINFREHFFRVPVLRSQVRFPLALELARPILAKIPCRIGITRAVSPATDLALGCGVIVGMDAEDATA